MLMLRSVLLQKPLESAGRRCIWGYVAIAFNRVDADRLALVGPDRLCTEWLLKNGGAVHITDMPGKRLSDYNSLPAESRRFKVKVADATKASIMKIGLDHFKGCDRIDTVIFDQCKHLEEDGLTGLLHLKDSLKHLQVSECNNLRDEGFKVIGELKNLKELKIFNFLYVKDLTKVVEDLQRKLPGCKIITHSEEKAEN